MPHTAVPPKPLDFTQVKITDSFWSARQKVFICKVIPTGIENVEKKSGGIPNIINAAKKNRGLPYEPFSGELYVDGDVHKVLESMCYALQIDAAGDPETADAQNYIRRKLEEWIPYYVDAQEPDGYFDTYFTLGACGEVPKWYDFDRHELFVAGHFYEAAAAHYRATGKSDPRLLNMAVKNADYLTGLFGPGKWKQVPGHEEIELALIKLAALCREIGGSYAERAERYTALAKFFLETRGDHEGRHGINHDNAYDQDHLPVAEQTEAVGHAVRACYLYTAMAEMALLEQSAAYDRALLSLWDDVEHKKTYVTGGIGSHAAHEGFGAAYELPNDTAYCETCANIANIMWNRNMNLLYGDSKYADVIERGFYDAVLCCVNFDGDRFFYGNPLSSPGDRHRSAWFGTACCPPNLMRMIESLGGYLYTQQDTVITCNLYIGNEAAFQVGQNVVKLHTATGMPWRGDCSVSVETPAPLQFTLRFRIPNWADGPVSAAVNGAEALATPDQKGYIEITRAWKSGDTVELCFPMKVQRVHSDPRVAANYGLVAIQRGPIVYTAENADNEYPVTQYILPENSAFTESWTENLDGKSDPYGIKSLMRLSAGARVIFGGKEVDSMLTLIPYYAWDNRTAGEMTVYIRESFCD